MSNVLAMDPTVIMPWVPKVDNKLPKNQQLTIMYKQLDMKESALFDDDQIKNIQKKKTTEYKYLISQMDIKRIEATIKDWKNFKYPIEHPELSGKDVPFSLENITLLPPEIRREYVNFITGRDRDAEEGEDLGEAQTV